MPGGYNTKPNSLKYTLGHSGRKPSRLPDTPGPPTCPSIFVGLLTPIIGTWTLVRGSYIHHHLLLDGPKETQGNPMQTPGKPKGNPGKPQANPRETQGNTRETEGKP